MFKPHDYAFQIETTTKAIFKPGDYGLGVVMDSDFIEKNPFIPISLVLGNFYNKIDYNSKVLIDDFMERYYWLMDKSIEEIGKPKIEEVIKEFNRIVNVV